MLAGNDIGGWTRPAPGLYPHQWLWDSCFIAIGLARLNPERAATELLSLARGQWQNGMMPHMIYNPRLPYSLESLLWGTGKLSVRGGAKTSGMTQPPMLAIAVEKVAQALPLERRPGFLAAMLPVIIKFHTWIYRERDPTGTGLAVVLHSWESGLDDTPAWTEAMDHLPKPPLHWRWLREYRLVQADERATPRDLQHMLSLAHLMKRYRYDSLAIMEHSSVVLNDLVFNAVLAAANEALERLAELASQVLPPELQARFAPTRRALEQLWDPQTEQYYPRDYLSGQLIRTPSAMTFMPLFAGTASPSRAERLRQLLVDGSGYNVAFPLPSVPTTSRSFEPQRYWRGPVWINLNWFVLLGLERYGFGEEAGWLRAHTLGLVQQTGFREYYHPLTGAGLGAHNFSWSAALTLDLLASQPADELGQD